MHARQDLSKSDKFKVLVNYLLIYSPRSRSSSRLLYRIASLELA